MFDDNDIFDRSVDWKTCFCVATGQFVSLFGSMWIVYYASPDFYARDNGQRCASSSYGGRYCYNTGLAMPENVAALICIPLFGAWGVLGGLRLRSGAMFSSGSPYQEMARANDINLTFMHWLIAEIAWVAFLILLQSLIQNWMFNAMALTVMQFGVVVVPLVLVLVGTIIALILGIIALILSCGQWNPAGLH
jgi:hypothetical protein